MVEDAPEAVTLLRAVLGRDDFEVTVVGDGNRAVQAARELRPEVVLLDLGLPGMDGIDVCRRLRAFSDAYIIMVTARDEETDRVVGLETGADDYVTKPYSPRELVARIRAMLRRPRVEHGEDAVRRVGDLAIDRAAVTVHRGTETVALTPIEFGLLDTLASRPGQAFTRDQLRERVWGPDWYGSDHVVDVHIANLRKKVDRPDWGSMIRTVRGVGYALDEPATGERPPPLR